MMVDKLNTLSPQAILTTIIKWAHYPQGTLIIVGIR